MSQWSPSDGIGSDCSQLLILISGHLLLGWLLFPALDLTGLHPRPVAERQPG
jgi:hypothetical protein